MRTPKYKAFFKPHNYIYHVTDMNFEGPDYTLREVKLSNGIWVRSDKLDDIILLEQSPFKDKNNKEIYDEDILEIFIVEDGKKVKSKLIGYFDKDEGQWMFCDLIDRKLEFSFSMFHTYIDREYEVIGNIYENPELISKTPNHEH